MDSTASQLLSGIEKEYYLAKFDLDRYAIISRYGKYGAVNSEGNIIVPCIYKDIVPIEKDYNTFWQRNYEGYVFGSTGYAAVLKNEKWGIIDKQNNIISDCIYDKIFYHSEGLFSVLKDKKCGCINNCGIIEIPFDFTHIYGFINGYAVFYHSELVDYLSGSTIEWPSHCYGILHQNGKIVHNNIYKKILQLPTGTDFIVAENDSDFNYKLDVVGNKFPIIGIEDIYNDFKTGYAVTRSSKNKNGVVNEFGNIIIPAIYDSISNFNGKFFLCYKSDNGFKKTYYQINNKGDIIN